ncbi:MAG TPA: DUF4386 domain-containing protein [Chitinophagales bacterium]|nr:DUF4386 domain-containing protein [Chitinophagales bacterium]
MLEQTSLKKTAHLTGALYFILAILGIYNLEYLPSQIVVHGDAAATCRNILSHEFLFRLGIATSVISNILYTILALMFYRLFKNVDKAWSVLLVIFVLVQVPISFILETFDITALLLLKGEVLKSLDAQKTQEYATLFRKLSGNGIRLMEIFWGLWLLPMGILIYRSRFIPRIIGVLVLLTAFAYTAESIIFILSPDSLEVLGKFIFPLFLGELSIIFWLLIKGVKKSYVGKN